MSIDLVPTVPPLVHTGVTLKHRFDSLYAVRGDA